MPDYRTSFKLLEHTFHNFFQAHASLSLSVSESVTPSHPSYPERNDDEYAHWAKHKNQKSQSHTREESEENVKIKIIISLD